MSRRVVHGAGALTVAVGLSVSAVDGVSAAPPDHRASYIVVLEGGADPAAEAERNARRHGGQVGYVYRHAVSGFSIEVTARAAAAIERSPRVARVEAVQPVSISEQTVPTGVARAGASGNTNLDIDSTDDLRVDVDVAVIDTGIDLDHPDLNVVAATDCMYESGGPPWRRTATCGSGGDDGNGHGTHVAGSAAALDNGIGVVGMAPGARLWAVKVLSDNGSGSTATVIAGIDHVVANADQIEVANLSLGGGFSQTLNDAVANAVDHGVTMVVAAGNEAQSASQSSPASEPSAVTVSALADFDGSSGGNGSPTCRNDVDDTFADFSNYGSPVDMIAPGVCILSTVPGGYDTYSGTSMASPHVAGAVALLRSTGASHAQAVGDLLGAGSTDWNDADDPDGIKEPLLDVSDTTVFAPATVDSGAGGGGGGDDGGDGGGGTEPPSTGTTFDGSSVNNGSSWTAVVSVSGAAAGQQITGAWGDGSSATSGCTADAAGNCSFQRSGIAKKVSSVTWTDDGSGTSVAIGKP